MYAIEYRGLTDQVYDAVRDMVLSGALAPGEKLIQDELAERLGVSRTPLLAAFSKLEKDMLLESKPRRGMFVRSYSPDELVQVYDVRVRLEPLGAAEAATHASPQDVAALEEVAAEFRAAAIAHEPEARMADYRFHMQVMRMSRNELLYNIIASYNIIVIANSYGFQKDPRVSADEHDRIAAAIRDGSRRAAMRQMYQHVANSRRHLVEHIRREAASA